MTGPFPPASRYIEDSFLETSGDCNESKRIPALSLAALLHASVLCAAITIGIG